MAYTYSGAITFGLVYIPISLSTCIKENEIGFNMIDKNTKSRIKYKKTCVDCNDKEIKNEDIVKGYQYEKDKYVIFTNDDFEMLKTQKDKNITIEQFVDLKEIDPIYFDKSYYVQPNGGEKAYTVLKKAMKKLNKAGIAKTILGNKETLVLIRESNDNLIVNTLYYYNEVQNAPKVKEEKIEKQELELASTLINQMTQEFKPEKFKDEYYEKVKKAIETKIAGNKIVSPKDKDNQIKILDIMEALQKSLILKNKKKMVK